MRTLKIAIIIGTLFVSGHFLSSYNRLYRYQVPEQMNDGWETAYIRDVGLSIQPINRLMNRILNGEYEKLHCVLIVKDNRLVFEEYFDGHKFNWSGRGFRGEYVEYERDTLHHLS
jgi:hypothetical protein